jgi:NAD(P)-dependent dehydrogenase (short-subunit alcohol dehydrogenase family)
MGQLDGKVALVTGGASGIGRATSERLAAEGARVFLVDRDADGARTVATAIGGVAHAADCGDAAEVDAAFAACTRELGGIDIAYMNAGIAIGVSDLTQLDQATYDRIQRINVDGVVYGVRAAIGAMRERGGGAIVATSSLAGLIPFPPDPIYDGGKHFVVGLIRSLAPTLAPFGITANTVNPGLTDTNIIGDDAKRFLAEADFPIMAPSQIAEAVLTLVTTGVTGQCWVCQPGRDAVAYEFRDVPGPRASGAQGRRPPGLNSRGE